MNRKVSLGAAISFCTVIAALTFTLTMFFSLNYFNTIIPNARERGHLLQEIINIDNVVRANYLGDIDENDLRWALANGYMDGLDDDYARYYSFEEYNIRSNDADGITVGIGVSVVANESGYIEVVDIYDDSPAQRSEMAVGELIVMIGDVDVLEIDYDQAVSMMRGDEGTYVTITVRNEGVDRPLTLLRERVEIKSISHRFIGDNGYIKISRFNNNTGSQFADAVADLKSQGATGLIIDLRNNPGGTLEGVLATLRNLLPEGPMLKAVYKNDREEIKEKYVNDGKNEEMLPMVTIANGRSASAAELFVAAMKDYNKAKMIGTKTFGKGIMQEEFKLDSGGAISFTVAYYNPPVSANYHKIGISPEFEVSITAAQDAELRAGTLDEENDTQLKKAIEVLESQK
ncbi:MAG: S41 family peptidase [Oscillospiraceae bacterium]|nr:S41 family peptidase [Oscillospiraceae bacterium]